MRTTLAILACLCCSSSLAKEQKQPAADWSFGCRTPNTGESEKDQPCWVQSTVITMAAQDGMKEGKLYFQVHFFSDRKVLRVSIECENIRYLRPAVRAADGHLMAWNDMTLLGCRDRACWGETEIDEDALKLMGASPTITLLGSTTNLPEDRGWGFYDVLTSANFSESIGELRAWRESIAKPK